MKKLPPELLILIYQHIDNPISLILVNKTYHRLYTSPVAKSTWALVNYNKIHVLFFAISMGKTFITVDVVKSLLASKANLSRYFIQRLLLQYGQYDEDLIKLKSQDNDNNLQEIDHDKLKKIKPPWASDIGFDVFITLLNEAEARFGPSLPLKGNDIEKFHFLSSGQLPIDQASKKIENNLEEIRDLIVNKKFTPFPPRPKISYEDTHDYFRKTQIINREEFPSKDGYENSRHLHIIARAILLENSIVDMWKDIGYYDICKDVNDLVIQGCILRLFPLNTPTGRDYPNKNLVVRELKKLLKLGFKLTKAAMVNILCFCEELLDSIGDPILIDSFHEIRREPKPVIIQKCLIEITHVDREINKNHKVLDFLFKCINESSELEFMFLKTISYHFFDTETKKAFDNLEISIMRSRLEIKNYENYVSISGKVKSPKLEDALLLPPFSSKRDDHDNNNSISIKDGSDPFVKEEDYDDYFVELLNKYQNLVYMNCINIKNYDIENPINGIRTLTLRSSLYSWILKNFDPNSMVTKLCFHDIILSRIWIDIEKQHHPERDIATIVRGCAIDSIILIYEDFCKNFVPFEIHHMKLLKKSTEKTTLEVFFEIFLPRVFDINIKQEYQPEPVEGVKGVDDETNNDEINQLRDMYPKWSYALEEEYNIIKDTSSTDLFKEYVDMIYREKNYVTKFNLKIKHSDGVGASGK